MKFNRLHCVWLGLSLPAIYTLFAYITGHYSYGQALSLSGYWSLWILILVIAVTPIGRLFPKWRGARILLKYRRALGVSVFGYAALHLCIYLAYKADTARIIKESMALEIITGWIAFFIFIPLAYTSRNISVRTLGRNWKRLHLWVYPAAILVCFHVVLTAFDPTENLIYSGIIVGIICLRVWMRIIKTR